MMKMSQKSRRFRAGISSFLFLSLLVGSSQATAGTAAESQAFHLDSPYAFKSHQHKVQLHSHTNLSDGDHEPNWVMRAYEEIGYAAVAITDHDHMNWTPTLEDPGGHNIVHLPGVEYSGTRTQSWDHMLGIGIETIHHADGMRNRVAQTEQAHLEGGVVYLCHPYDAEFRHRRGWERSQVTNPEHRFNGIEIHNGGSYTAETPGGDYPYKVDAALMSGKEIHLIAVDDFHRNPATAMDRGFVVINSDLPQEDLTAEEVLEALRTGNFFASGRTSTRFPEPPRFTDIRIEDQTITVKTDKACTIDFINVKYNYFTRYSENRDPYVHREVGTTSAQYQATAADAWVRVKATYIDESGESYAWSNPIHIRGRSSE